LLFLNRLRYLWGVKLLFIGDIVGEPGRRAVREIVPRLVARHGLHWVIANGENSAGGNGITAAIAKDLFSYGVDVITTGDHAWDQRDMMSLLEKEPRVLRPGNYSAGVPGKGTLVFHKEGLPPLGVMNLQGRTFMPPLDNPFPIALAEVAKLRTETPIILLDFHGEATSEKQAMGRLLDGSVTAVIGTHTHVQTADEQIYPKGTAYLSDAGFTGPHESILGREMAPIIQRFMNGLPQRFEVASGRVLLHGAIVELDPATGLAKNITRVSEPLPPT